MHCEKFESRLQEVLDARQRPENDEALLAHADHCESCRELLLAQEQLFAGLELWEAPALSSNFSARVLTAVAEEPILAVAVPLKSTSRRRWLGLAIAAALLVAVVPVTRWLTMPGAVAPIANDAPAVPQQPAPAVVQTPAVPAVQPVMAEVAPPTPMPFSPQQLAAGSEEVLRSLQQLPDVPVDQSVERIPGFRPIATSFGVAFHGFRRTLPGGKDAPPPAENKSPPPTKPQADSGRLQNEVGLV